MVKRFAVSVQYPWEDDLSRHIVSDWYDNKEKAFAKKAEFERANTDKKIVYGVEMVSLPFCVSGEQVKVIY